jgi:hypothetical protein
MLRMRERAEKALGPGFDLSAFRAAAPMNGSMPLAVLDDVVDEWIQARRVGPAPAVQNGSFAWSPPGKS